MTGPGGLTGRSPRNAWPGTVALPARTFWAMNLPCYVTWLKITHGWMVFVSTGLNTHPISWIQFFWTSPITPKKPLSAWAFLLSACDGTWESSTASCTAD